MTAGRNVIEIRGLWTEFNTHAQFVVHQDLDLDVQRGEVLSLVGGSGTGKTVLLRQILGLESPSRGSVSVLGQAPPAWANAARPAAWACCSSTGRCSRPSACWTTSPLPCASSRRCRPS
jgi:ABC-type transporter Mla maintaining outer membrane lipid asymmetry ATPase subunit MlaF